jgi:hypothetical protein
MFVLLKVTAVNPKPVHETTDKDSLLNKVNQRFDLLTFGCISRFCRIALSRKRN